MKIGGVLVTDANKDIFEQILYRINAVDENIIRFIYDYVIEQTKCLEDDIEVQQNVTSAISELAKRRAKISQITWDALWKK